MTLIVNASGQLEDVSEEEAQRRKAGYAAIAADVAGRGQASPVSLLRGGQGGAGVNMMGPPSGPAPSSFGDTPVAATGLPEALSEDERIAKRTAEIDKMLGLDQPRGMSSAPDRERDGGMTVAPGPAGAGGAPGLAPLPVPTPGGRHVEGGVTTTTRTKVDKQELEGFDREQKALEAEKGIAGRETELATKKAGAEHAAALGQQSADEGQAAAKSLASQHWNDLVSKDKAKYDAAVAERSRMKMEKFGEGDPVWKGIGRALMIGLGELGRSMTKSGHNTALEIIDAQAQEHYMLEKQRLEEGDKKVGNARQGMLDTREAKAEAMADLEREHAAWNKALASKARAEAASFGTEHAKIEGEKIANAAEQRAAQNIQRLGALRRVQVESRTSWTNTTGAGAGAGGGNPTEKQTMLAILSQQMQGELDTISKNAPITAKVLSKMQSQGLGAEAADRAAAAGLTGAAGVAVARALGLVPKSKYEGMTPQEQLVANAWDNAVEKYARVLTGAGMPIDEARRLALQDAPHAGDSPVVMAQKFRRMQSFAQQAMSLSGKAGQQIAPAAPGAGPGAAGPSPDDQAAIQWARSNPNDPRARKILQMHGM